MKEINFHLSKVRGIISYGLGPLLGLISGPILAHALGPAGRGQFASVMEPLTIATVIASFGIPSAVTFFISKGHNPKHVLKFASLITIAPTFVIGCLLLAYSGPVSASQNLPRAFIAGAWTFVFVSVALQIRRAFWQGFAGWLVLDTERGIFSALRFIAVVLAAIMGAKSAEYFVVVQLCAVLTAALILWLPWKNHPSQIRQKLGRRTFFRYSALASVGAIAMVANNRIDQVLMPAQTSNDQMGFYAVAVTVAEVPLVFAALAARDTMQMSGAGNSLRAILDHSKIYLWFTIITSVFLGTGAGWYLPLLFGVDFRPAIPALQLLCAGSVLTSVALVSISFIAGQGFPTYSSLVPLSGLLVTVFGFAFYWTHVDATVAAIISITSQGSAAAVGVILSWQITTRQKPK